MTHDEIRDYVLDRLGISSSDTEKTGQITDIMNQVYYALVDKYRLKVTSGSLTITADDPVVPLPTGWLSTIRIYEGTNVWRETDFDAYVNALTEGVSSIFPEEDGLIAYVQSGDELRRHPTPSASGTATIFYVVKPTALAGANSPDEVPAQFHDLIAERVVERIAMSEEEAELVAGASAIANRLTRELELHLGKRSGMHPYRMTMKGYEPR